MGSTLLAHHTLTHFHSLIHTLAGLNEIRPLSVQYQHQLYPIWLLRLPQRPPKDERSKEDTRNQPLAGAQTAEAVYQSLVLGDRKETSKVVMCPIPAWSPSSATLTLRAVFSTSYDSWFLGGCLSRVGSFFIWCCSFEAALNGWVFPRRTYASSRGTNKIIYWLLTKKSVLFKDLVRGWLRSN